MGNTLQYIYPRKILKMRERREALNMRTYTHDPVLPETHVQTTDERVATVCQAILPSSHHQHHHGSVHVYPVNVCS